MKRFALLQRKTAIVLLCLALPGMAQAIELAGVTVEPRIRLEGQELALNGTGIRSRFMIKVYVAALYVAELSANPQKLIGQPGAKRMALTLLRDVSGEKLLDAMHEGLNRNSSPDELALMQDQIAQMSVIFRTVGEGRKGDLITLDWVPSRGTVIRINGVARGQAIPNENFYRSLLRIWLGEQPAQKDLRDALSGRVN
jgi:hypothetical protein